MHLILAVGQGITILLSRIGMIACAALVGLGVPAVWIWVGSQLQGGTTPSATALAVVHAGLIATLLLIVALFSAIVARSRARERQRIDWMRGQSEVRRRETLRGTHPLELIIIIAVLLDIVVFLVWFFFLADPGTPVGQG